LTGLATGGVFVLVPLYISEIAEDNIRGILGSFFIFSINMGTLLMFVAGNYLSYSLVPRLMISIPIIFLLTFFFLPETPQYLLKCGKAKQAENSLKFLRGCEKGKEVPQKVKSELLEMSKKIDEESRVKGQSIRREISEVLRQISKKNLIKILKFFSDFPAAKKALIIGIVLVAVNQLCGAFAFINYTAEIFMESGSSLSPNMSAIIVAIIQVAGSTGSAFAIGSMSRKLLYAFSCFGTIVGLVAMGVHGYLKMNYDMGSFNWVPVASLSFVIFVASIGILPLTFVMLTEVLPQKVS
jgi:ABC-type multidrug transport system fused ATPase/permease subunit